MFWRPRAAFSGKSLARAPCMPVDVGLTQTPPAQFQVDL